MEIRKKVLPIEGVKEIDIVNYLSKLGYEPTKVRAFDYWYFSPLRNEKTPSFKVNRRLKLWFDFGIGKGGSIIDFGTIYFSCSISDFLCRLSTNFSLDLSHHFNQQDEHKKRSESKLKVLTEIPLFSYALYQYFQERKIPFEIAKKYCKQITYRLNNKDCFGIGFKNDSGGYEIGNSYTKISSSPKDITTINNGSKEALVFEGFFDFLSFISIQKNEFEKDKDFVILNSVSFFEKARSFMESHEVIQLYLDRDSTGQNYSRYGLSLGNKYQDKSDLYKPFKDVNEWLMKDVKTNQRNFRQKPG